MGNSGFGLKIKSPAAQRYLFIVIIVGLGVSIYVLNCLFPIYSDDWAYSYVEANLDSNPTNTRMIGGVIDILESQYNHYFEWGGRSIVHFIAQFLLWIGPSFHNILNAGAYVLLLYIIYLICNTERQKNISVFLLVSSLVWFLTPRFTSDVLWITGSANYMWGSLIVLSFLFFYIRVLSSNTVYLDDSVLKRFIFFFAGIISGWSNEGMALAAIILTFSFSLYLRRNKRLPQWAIWGFVGLCIGFAIMILAPGNMVRSNLIETQHPEIFNQPFLIIIKTRLLEMLSYKYLHYMLPPSLIFLVLLMIYCKWGNFQNNEMRNNVLSRSILFFLMAQLSFFIMVLSPTFPLWAMFGQILLLVLGIGTLYANLNFKIKSIYYLNILFLFILVGLYSIDYYRKYPSIKLISDVYKEREVSLTNQVSQGVEDIVFDKRIVVHSKFDLIDLSADSTSWFNRKYAFYHGVRSVRIIPNKE